MKFKDAIKKGIRWEANPALSAINEEIRTREDMGRNNKRLKEQAGYYFFIEVLGCFSSLAICECDEQGVVRPYLIEDPPLTAEEMADAVEDAGGGINRSGWYPISPQVEDKLRLSY